MKIALWGYGRMGKTIERIATANGDEVILKIDVAQRSELMPEQLQKADVVIEFTQPESAFDNLSYCLAHGVPVISGTTGWLDRYPELVAYCQAQNGAFLYASNFSLGVNLFFALNDHLAKLMAPYTNYRPMVEEIHHTKKLDAPSGTAITLAEGILTHDVRFDSWVNTLTKEGSAIGITSKRIPDVPGTHEITYQSTIDELAIKHTAHSRDGFAHGAWLAARWLVGKKGVYSMKDVLGL